MKCCKDNLIKLIRPFIGHVHFKRVQRGQVANLLFESTEDQDSTFIIVDFLYISLHMAVRTHL